MEAVHTVKANIRPWNCDQIYCKKSRDVSQPLHLFYPSLPLALFHPIHSVPSSFILEEMTVHFVTASVKPQTLTKCPKCIQRINILMNLQTAEGISGSFCASKCKVHFHWQGRWRATGGSCFWSVNTQHQICWNTHDIEAEKVNFTAVTWGTQGQLQRTLIKFRVLLFQDDMQWKI